MEKRDKRTRVDASGSQRFIAGPPGRGARTPAATTITIAIRTSETAEPKGQSRAVVNWFWIRLPIMTVLPPPSRSGVR